MDARVLDPQALDTRAPDARGFAARIHDLPSLPRRAIIGAFIVMGFIIGWFSLATRSPELPIALWWPAIGVLFVAVVASRGRRVGVTVVVVIAATLSHVLGGAPLALAIAYGAANGLELWVVARVLTRGKAHAGFSSLGQIGWFLVSAGVGALFFAIIAGGAGAIFAGANLVLATSSLLTSHGSALLAIAPLALVPLTVPLRVPRWEPVVQTVALGVLTFVVFAPVPGALALTFLILTALMWGAYRLPPLVVALQTLILALVATTATSGDVGPFAELLGIDLNGGIFALQLFVLTHAATGLFVSGQNADWQESLRALTGREQDAIHVADNLRQLNRQKDDFVSAVSHELRTPVTSILGFAELLVEQDVDELIRSSSRIIYRNARRLADVIEDVLELGQITSADASVRAPTEVDLARLLTESVEDATGLVTGGRDVRVKLDLPREPVVLRGVEQDLSRVCSNLLSNAMKFSPAGGTVTVTLAADDDTIELRFADEGPGIPLADQEAVWERFYRVQSARHSDVPGTGLGLPIVRALVQKRIGGDVELHSDGHQGTTVVVRVPRRPHREGNAPRPAASHPAGA